MEQQLAAIRRELDGRELAALAAFEAGDVSADQVLAFARQLLAEHRERADAMVSRLIQQHKDLLDRLAEND